MSSWTGKSRGNLLGYKIVIFVLKRVGLAPTYVLLKAISFYYFLFASEPRKHIINFYKNRLGYSAKQSRAICAKNFYILAQTILDRIALTAGLAQKISYTQNGEEALVAWAKTQKGGFLISGHVGNWSVAGNLLKALNVKVNVLLVENEVAALRQFFESQNKISQFYPIVIKEDLSHFIQIYNAIKAGEFVCVNADRFLPGAKTYNINFLGAEAPFPQGIFNVIAKLKVNYAFVFSVKKSKFQYHFWSTKPTTAQDGGLVIAQEYAAALADCVKQNPEQWFNYYDFYQTSAHP